MEEKILAYINGASQLITMGTAVVMAYLAWKTYLKEPVQPMQPAAGGAMPSAQSGTSELLVFDTRKQQTTLRVSPEGLECFLRDKGRGTVKRQWIIPVSELPAILESERIRVNSAYKPNTGLFAIGPRVNWMYSKHLFPEARFLEDEIRRLLALQAQS